MFLLKLEYNNEYVLLPKNNNAYIIKTIKDWIMLTNFSSSFLITQFPHGKIKTIVDKKFVYNQNYELDADLDFNYKYILPLCCDNNNSNIYI